jgi:shikimate dehydrogenase
MTAPRTTSIDGATQLLFIVGSPVGQVKAPQRFNPRFAAKRLNMVMLPLEADSASFAAVVGGLMHAANVRGIVVTVPHKFEALALAHELGADGQACGAVNALVRLPDGRWHGDMFDGKGFVAGLRAAGHKVKGARVLMAGAGGAGTAIAAALLQAGALTVDVFDVDEARAHALVKRLRGAGGDARLRAADSARTRGFHSLVVNATPAGMQAHDPMPLDLDALCPRAVVADVIMTDVPTPLLREAAARGHPVVAGDAMLDGQLRALERYFLSSLEVTS